MEESKVKEIEARLNQLFAQTDRAIKDESPIKNSTGNVRVIRRRKGQPDVHIA